MFRHSPQKPSTPRFAKAKYWIKHHKKVSIIIGVILLLLVIGGAATAVYYMNQTPKVVSTPKPVTPEPIPEPPKYYSPLSGNQLDSEAATRQATTGIMMC